MQPYLGILVDSFWEAVHNKVLWALLATSTFLLVALAPFGLVVERNFRFGTYDIYDHQRLVSKLARGLDGRGSPGIAAIAQTLDPLVAGKLRRQAQEKDGSLSISEMVDELNRLLTESKLYSETAFPTAIKRERLRPLIEQIPAGLSPEDQQQLNSELLQITLAPELGPPRGEQIWVGYAGFKIGTPLAITHRQIKTYVEPLILQLVVQFGLGVMIVFVAIIVTSPMIPDTFRSGALHLLLSKPISRTWLFLWKFAGGCIFVSLNLAYVLVGLFIIVGLRFGIWNTGLLACVPLLLFVYIIFYSVSALAGLVWGNAIVSVVTCIVFWAFCFAIGTMHDILQVRVEQWPLIHRIEQIGPNVVAVNEAGVFSVWNEEYSVWQPASEFSLRAEGVSSTTFGPFDDPQRHRILVKTFMPFNALENLRQQRNRSLTIIPLESSSTAPQSLDQARETAHWNTLPGPEIPEQVFRILELDGKLLVISRLGLYRMAMEQILPASGSNRSFFGLPARTAFQEVSPRGFRLTDNTTAATVSNHSILVYTSGTVSLMRLEDPGLRLTAETKLDGDGSEAALLAGTDGFCVVARDNLPISIFDGQLNPISQVDLPKGEKPKQLHWIGNSQLLAVLTHSGKLYQLDCSASKISSLPIPVDGRFTCMNWVTSEQLWLGISPNSAVLVDLRSSSVLRRLSPQPKTSERFFNYLVSPVYRYTPKPSALSQSMQYLLTGSTTFDPQLITVKLDTAKVQLDIWQPMISNTIFVLVVLTASCIYLSRKEY